MNIAIECEVVLSKKFEAICEAGEPISLHVASISGNKGRGILRIVCKDGVTAADVAKIGETSLPIKIISASEDIKSMGGAQRYGNLMGGLPMGAEGIAAVTSPDHPAGEAYVPPVPPPPAQPLPARVQAYVQEQPVAAPVAAPVRPQMPIQQPPPAPAAPANQASPDAFRIALMAMKAAGIAMPPQMEAMLQNTVSQPAQAPRPTRPPDNSIKTFDELMTELQNVPGVDDSPRLPTDRKLTPREADAFLSRMPRLRRKAFMRNLMNGQLMISDLYTTFDGGGQCIFLLPGAAFDLSRIPARNILNSTDLRWAFDTGKAELVDHATYAACFKKVNDDMAQMGRSELPVFSGESRINPHESSGGVAEQFASGAGMADEKESIHIGGSGEEPISISVGASGDDRPPSVPWEESPEMQALIGHMPEGRPPPQAKTPRRM